MYQADLRGEIKREKPKSQENNEVMLDLFSNFFYLVILRKPQTREANPWTRPWREGALTWFMAPAWLSCPGCWRGGVCRGPIGDSCMFIWPNWLIPMSLWQKKKSINKGMKSHLDTIQHLEKKCCFFLILLSSNQLSIKYCFLLTSYVG